MPQTSASASVLKLRQMPGALHLPVQAKRPRLRIEAFHSGRQEENKTVDYGFCPS